MNPDEIAIYLQENPGFFEEYAGVLAQIQIPNPHGGQAIALADRQVLSLREKSRMLEAKLLREVLVAARENRLDDHRTRLEQDLDQRREVIG